MVYFETANGGAVFSAGAIAWCGGLSHNGYDNNVSRITDNVLSNSWAERRVLRSGLPVWTALHRRRWTLTLGYPKPSLGRHASAQDPSRVHRFTTGAPPMRTYGFAATDAAQPLAPFSFERREPRANDVGIEILYCGICHSDLHQSRNDGASAATRWCPATRSSAG